MKIKVDMVKITFENKDEIYLEIESFNELREYFEKENPSRVIVHDKGGLNDMVFDLDKVRCKNHE